MVQKQEFYRQTIQEAAASLHTDPKRGLSAPEEVAYNGPETG